MTFSSIRQLVSAWRPALLQLAEFLHEVFSMIVVAAFFYGAMQLTHHWLRAYLDPGCSKEVIPTWELRSSTPTLQLVSVSGYADLPMLAQATGGTGENPIYKIFVKALKMLSWPLALLFMFKFGYQVYRKEVEESVWTLLGAVIGFFASDIVQYLFGAAS